MSLIVEINPVPWKILALVKARILKNRAKQKKQGMNWSTDELKRAMSLQPHPLSKRKKQEPSFIMENGIYQVFSLGEHYRSSVQGYYASKSDIWRIYVQIEGQEKKPALYLLSQVSVPPYPPTPPDVYTTGVLYARNAYWDSSLSLEFTYTLRSIVYVSNFIDPETDEYYSISAIITILTTTDPKRPVPVANAAVSVDWTDIPHSETPLHAWPYGNSLGDPNLEPGQYTGYDTGYVDENYPFGPDEYDFAVVPSPLYDISKLETMPGYIDTVTDEYSG
jgi:hypothetical protein